MFRLIRRGEHRHAPCCGQLSDSTSSALSASISPGGAGYAKSSGPRPAAIRATGDRLFHFHVSDNDRGVPGGGHYDFAEPDWAEFFEVIKGNGPCNEERLEARRNAWDEGAWFRDGLTAYADKAAARRTAGRVAAE